MQLHLREKGGYREGIGEEGGRNGKHLGAGGNHI